MSASFAGLDNFWDKAYFVVHNKHRLGPYGHHRRMTDAILFWIMLRGYAS
jgi:hypothetical protein